MASSSSGLVQLGMGSATVRRQACHLAEDARVWLSPDTSQLERMIAAAVVAAGGQASEAHPNDPRSVRPPSPGEWRGIPVQTKGVQGAIPGTAPSRDARLPRGQ